MVASITVDEFLSKFAAVYNQITLAYLAGSFDAIASTTAMTSSTKLPAYPWLRYGRWWCCAQQTGMHILVVEALLIAIFLSKGRANTYRHRKYDDRIVLPIPSFLPS